jgi:hypothetical protein
MENGRVLCAQPLGETRKVTTSFLFGRPPSYKGGPPNPSSSLTLLYLSNLRSALRSRRPATRDLEEKSRPLRWRCCPGRPTPPVDAATPSPENGRSSVLLMFGVECIRVCGSVKKESLLSHEVGFAIGVFSDDCGKSLQIWGFCNISME